MLGDSPKDMFRQNNTGFPEQFMRHSRVPSYPQPCRTLTAQTRLQTQAHAKGSFGIQKLYV